MNVIKVPIAQLVNDPNNARKHGTKNISAIKGSLAKFGQQKPIVIDAKNVVIAGNGTLEAAKQLGWTHINAVVTELDDLGKMAFALADNKTSELAEWDDPILAEQLDWLDKQDFDISDIGFEDYELPGESKGTDGLTDPDEVPEVPQNVFGVKRGDIWLLGNHRLMCGDSTSEDDVKKLMDGQKADMVFTDPPYGMNLNVDYDDMFKNDTSKHLFTGKRFSKVIGDNEYYSPKHILDFFDYCKEIFLWGADYYFWDLPKNGSIFCWDKRVDENMDKVAGNCIELCWSKYKHKKECIRLLWSGHHGMQSDDTKKRVHPTQKPAKLIEWFFERFKGQIIVDLFLGSGSTLIACEKTGRSCYGMELDEHYNSVIIKRWQDFTGKTAIKEV